MKMRRTAIVAFLLVACMVIGIGFAALSRELVVNGTLHAGARSDLQVWFTKAEIPTLTDGKTNQCSVANLSLSDGADKSLTVVMETASMQNVGDTAVAKFKIENQELASNAVHAKIYNPNFSLSASNSAFTNPDDYYTVTFAFEAIQASGETITIGTDTQGKPIVSDLPPQQAVYLVVTVTLDKSVITTDISHAATFTITYTAEAIEAPHD